MITSSSPFPAAVPSAPRPSPDPASPLRSVPGQEVSPTFGSLLNPTTRAGGDASVNSGAERGARCLGSELQRAAELAGADGCDGVPAEEAAGASRREDEDRARLVSESSSWIAIPAAGPDVPLATCPAFSSVEFIHGEAVEETAGAEVYSDAAAPIGTRAPLSAHALFVLDPQMSRTAPASVARDGVLTSAPGIGPQQVVGPAGEPGGDESALRPSAAEPAPAENAPLRGAPETPAEDRVGMLGFERHRTSTVRREGASSRNAVPSEWTEAAAGLEASALQDTSDAAPMGRPTLPRSDVGALASAAQVATSENGDDARIFLAPDRAADTRHLGDDRGRSHPAAEFSRAQAEGEPIAPMSERSTQRSEKKDALFSDQKVEAKAVPAVGIEAANAPAVMRSDSPTTPTPGVTTGSVAPMLVGAGHVGEVRVLEGSAPWTAVGRVLDAADVLWATDRAGVDLKLQLGGEGVWVRVDYRDGEVTATFRADSPELRDRLTAAWHQHVAGVGEQRPYRLSEPLFSMSDDRATGSSAHGSSAEGDTSRRGSSGREAADSASGERIGGVLPFSAARGSSPSEVNRINDRSSRRRLSVFA